MNRDRRPGAVALRYDADTHRAPEVVASGRGELARRILEIARASGVPVYQDADLVELLLALKPGVEIPERLYTAVAEVLAFVYRLNRGAGGPPARPQPPTQT